MTSTVLAETEEMTRPVLRVVNATKRYGNTEALRGVSFVVDGGVVGLLGANGAGKSTLFRAAVDLVTLDGGKVEVAGYDARRQSLEARRRIGYLPEELQLYDRLTGDEFLRLVAAMKGLDPQGKENTEERDELFELFDLGERRRVLIGEYSLGMRKKIGLSAALMGGPPLVLLDEPLNGLDTESMRKVRLRIETMAAAGSTFVISSHVMAFVERLCPRVVILRRGEVVADASPALLRERTGMADEPFEDVFLELAL